MKKVLPDILLSAGAALISFGAWVAWPPVGFAVAGGFLFLAGLKWPAEDEG